MRNGGVLFFWMGGVVMGILGRKVSEGIDFRGGFTNKNAQPVTLGCSVGSLLGQGNLRCGNNQSLELIVDPSGIMNEISKP